MNSIAQRARYHATMLLEPFTDFPLGSAQLDAFERNFRNRATDIDSISEVLFAEADALGIRHVYLEEIDRTPTAPHRVDQAVARLRSAMPVGMTIAYKSAEYDNLHEELRSELFAIWRQRADGVHRVRYPMAVA